MHLWQNCELISEPLFYFKWIETNQSSIHQQKQRHLYSAVRKRGRISMWLSNQYQLVLTVNTRWQLNTYACCDSAADNLKWKMVKRIYGHTFLVTKVDILTQVLLLFSTFTQRVSYTTGPMSWKDVLPKYQMMYWLKLYFCV